MKGVVLVGLVTIWGCKADPPEPGNPDLALFGGMTSVGTGGGTGGAGGAAPLGIEAFPGDPPAPMPGGPITAVVKSAGCGAVFAGESGQQYAMLTQGKKAGNCADMLRGKPVCGSWSIERAYTVFLPQGYDVNRAYPLVFEGPGCGGASRDVYPLNGISSSVIRVGIAPGPNSTGHGTNEEQGCFDDKEGDDSIDWVFYENLYDRLNADLCFDRNRVFVLGNSSGAWLSNELGCKYAGDSLRPIRGTGASNGGLPTEPKFTPTCTTAPLSGFWVHQINDTTTPFANTKVAIDRAMVVNHCTPSTSYDTATFANFPAGGGLPDDQCKLIQGCDPLYPLVVCALPGANRGSHDLQVNNGFSTFVKQFNEGPFITP